MKTNMATHQERHTLRELLLSFCFLSASTFSKGSIASLHKNSVLVISSIHVSILRTVAIVTELAADLQAAGNHEMALLLMKMANRSLHHLGTSTSTTHHSLINIRSEGSK